MALHGVRTERGRRNKTTSADMAVMWLWKQPRTIDDMIASGRDLLIIERGFIQPRFEWYSLAVNGFNGRGKFAPAPDGGARWQKYFSHMLRPWREPGGEYSLLIGQVPRDSALNGVDIVSWAQERTDEMVSAGHRVLYRPHPLGPTPCPRGAELSVGTLEQAFSGASQVVTYCSTTAVESVMAGIPAVIFDEGSVAYPMASHSIHEPLVRPDRTKWCHDLAWRQWRLDELADGSAWQHVQKAMP